MSRRNNVEKLVESTKNETTSETTEASKNGPPLAISADVVKYKKMTKEDLVRECIKKDKKHAGLNTEDLIKSLMGTYVDAKSPTKAKKEKKAVIFQKYTEIEVEVVDEDGKKSKKIKKLGDNADKETKITKKELEPYIIKHELSKSGSVVFIIECLKEGRKLSLKKWKDEHPTETRR